MGKKSWSDLSDGQKIGVIVGAVLQFGLLAAALWDLAHRSADEVRGDRRIWAGVVFINWIGPLAYFTVGRKECLFSFECSLKKSALGDEELETA